MKDEVVYIAGPISSCLDTYKLNFDEAVWELREMGYDKIINPCCVPSNLPYECYAPISIGFVQACDKVYALKGWEDSKGAKAEINYAIMCGKEIMFEPGAEGSSV